MTKPDQHFVSAVARSILAGDANAESIVARLGATLGRQRRWMRPLAVRYLKTYAGRTRPRRREVTEFLLRDRGFLKAHDRDPGQMVVASRFAWAAAMQPVAAALGWEIPSITDAGQLAGWLGIRTEELEWFADLKEFGRGKAIDSMLRHYQFQFNRKRSGGLRLIESPKLRLKELQRQILAWLLDKVPVHPAAHGFVRGRSVQTFAEPHARQNVVLRIDLKDFFPSIRSARVQALFRTMGYPETVADLFGGICTSSVPRFAWSVLHAERAAAELKELQAIYERRHLPQGAPTSPSLANLCAYRMDCRLWGLAEAAGARYSRYADDLAFSGGEEFARCAERFAVHVAAIALDEGFAVNHRKTRVMRQGDRQRLAGLVVNQTVNVDRRYLDELKAILHNCARLGPESQNRESHPAFREHLLGRIAYVGMVRPEKGARLRRMFDEIRWP